MAADEIRVAKELAAEKARIEAEKAALAKYKAATGTGGEEGKKDGN